MTLRSTVFVVQPTAEATLPKTMGRAMWACVLGLVGSREPDMAAALHDGARRQSPRPPRPCRDRLRLKGDRLRLQSGTGLRVSGQQRGPGAVRRAGKHRGAAAAHPGTGPGNPSRWPRSAATRAGIAGHSGSPTTDLYTATWQEAAGAAPLLTLEFVSPTVFLSQGRAVLWPEPHRVFGSLLQRWQAYAPALLPGDLEDAFAACLDVDAYDLQTRVQRYAKGAGRQVWYQKGFVGTCRYRAQRGTPEAVLRVAHLLARYALFAGVGSRTTVGMGQVRQVAGRR